jgi:hypothetical protein
LIVGAVILTSTAGSAADIQYDPRDAQKSAYLNDLVLQTRACARDYARALLTQGERDSATIVAKIMNVCGRQLPLQDYMTNVLGRPYDEVTAFIEALAYDELNHIPGVKRTPSKPGASP